MSDEDYWNYIWWDNDQANSLINGQVYKMDRDTPDQWLAQHDFWLVFRTKDLVVLGAFIKRQTRLCIFWRAQ